MKCSSLAALEVVILTTSSAASDENFVKMTTFLFQWMGQHISCEGLDMLKENMHYELPGKNTT